MASIRTLRPQILKSHPIKSLRSLSTSLTTPAAPPPPPSAAADDNPRGWSDHKFLQPNDYLNSWKPPRDPKEAEARLAQLRREYAKKVKAFRKDYIQEVELMRLEKQRKDDAKREAMRIATEERRAAKAAAKKAKAAEREIADQEFREMLAKERAEKLEYWRMRQKKIGEKKKEKKELVHKKSSMWIDEKELESKILAATMDATPL